MSTASTHDTSRVPATRAAAEDDGDGDGDAGEPSPPPAADDRAGAGAGRAARGLRTVGFHLVVLAAFTVPAVVLWWDVWTGHPSATLTCGCGDPAQEVWFMAWPAWAITHLHSLFFSGAVNVPDGANLLSNTSGTLVGVVLAPVTWAFGPVVATNVALTLAPALSAWGCFAAVRPLVSWKFGAVPAALLYGYSAAVVTSLVFGHVSVTVLVFPPLLFTTLHEIVIRQEHDVRRDGLVLAALLVGQFLVSPEVFVMCLLFALVGLAAVVVVGWRQLRPRAGHALPACYWAGASRWWSWPTPSGTAWRDPRRSPACSSPSHRWRGSRSRDSWHPAATPAPPTCTCVSGATSGARGPRRTTSAVGRRWPLSPRPVLGRRRPLTWLLVLLALVSFVLALGVTVASGPEWAAHIWLPWRALHNLPLLQEILPDQLAPFLALFVAFLLAVGLDALYVAHRRPGSWLAAHPGAAVAAAATALVAVLALVPVFVTFDLPLKVVPVGVPPYLREDVPALPSGTCCSPCRSPCRARRRRCSGRRWGTSTSGWPAPPSRPPTPRAARWATAHPARPGAS